MYYPFFSEHLKSLDVFEEQKKKALTDSSGAILTLMNYLMTVVGELEDEQAEIDREKLFKQFMQVKSCLINFEKVLSKKIFLHLHI